MQYVHTTTHHLRWWGLFSSMRSIQETFSVFCYRCTPTMTHLCQYGDQCTTQARSKQDSKLAETETEWALTFCVCVFTIFDHTTVSGRQPNGYLNWEEKRHWLLLCLSRVWFCEKKAINGGGTNSCFHYRLKGRKLLNKEDITGPKGGHHGVLKLDSSPVGLLLVFRVLQGRWNIAIYKKYIHIYFGGLVGFFFFNRKFS